MIRYLSELDMYPAGGSNSNGDGNGSGNNNNDVRLGMDGRSENYCEISEPALSLSDLELYRQCVNIGKAYDCKTFTAVTCDLQLTPATTTTTKSSATRRDMEQSMAVCQRSQHSDESTTSLRREYTKLFNSLSSIKPSDSDLRLYKNHVIANSRVTSSPVATS